MSVAHLPSFVRHDSVSALRSSLRSPRLLGLIVPVLVSAAVACGGHHEPPENAPTPGSLSASAGGGDTLYIVEYTVAPARREQFERFFSESYFPALRQVAKSDTGAARVLRQTRFLAPGRPNEDGTLSYLLVLDPVVPGETYNISALLRRVYPAADSDRLYRQLTESWARPFVARPYVRPSSPAGR